VAGAGLEDLTQMAGELAKRNGHDLGAWEAPDGEEAVARRAVCRDCGQVAYVRSEGALAGTGGPALTVRCSGR
jgi:hypothetical protein